MKAKGISKLCIRSGVLVASVCAASGVAVSCGGDVNMDCTTGRGDFAVHYIYPAGVTKDCGLGNGELVGAQTYQGQGTEKVGGEPLPDLKLAAAAIQADRLGAARDTAAARAASQMTGTPYAYGKWDKPRPDGNNICSVALMTGAVKNVEVPADAVDNPDTDEDETVRVPAQDLKYEWKNVRFYNTPGIQGLQFTADLTYTDGLYQPPDPALPVESCSVSVKAVGVFPAGNCMAVTTVHGVDATDTMPETGDAADLVTDSVPDATFCGDIKKSGVSSDFAVECVPATASNYQDAVYGSCTATEDDANTKVWEGPVCTNTMTTKPVFGFCFLKGENIPVLK